MESYQIEFTFLSCFWLFLHFQPLCHTSSPHHPCPSHSSLNLFHLISILLQNKKNHSFINHKSTWCDVCESVCLCVCVLRCSKKMSLIYVPFFIFILLFEENWVLDFCMYIFVYLYCFIVCLNIFYIVLLLFWCWLLFLKLIVLNFMWNICIWNCFFFVYMYLLKYP